MHDFLVQCQFLPDQLKVHWKVSIQEEKGRQKNTSRIPMPRGQCASYVEGEEVMVSWQVCAASTDAATHQSSPVIRSSPPFLPHSSPAPPPTTAAAAAALLRHRPLTFSRNLRRPLTRLTGAATSCVAFTR